MLVSELLIVNGQSIGPPHWQAFAERFGDDVRGAIKAAQSDVPLYGALISTLAVASKHKGLLSWIGTFIHGAALMDKAAMDAGVLTDSSAVTAQALRQVPDQLVDEALRMLP